MKENHEATIKQLVNNTEELLESYFVKAHALRDDEGIVRITINHEIEPNEFGEIIARSGISFAKRVKDEVEHVVDMTQLKLDLAQTNEEAP